MSRAEPTTDRCLYVHASPVPPPSSIAPRRSARSVALIFGSKRNIAFELPRGAPAGWPRIRSPILQDTQRPAPSSPSRAAAPPERPAHRPGTASAGCSPLRRHPRAAPAAESPSRCSLPPARQPPNAIASSAARAICPDRCRAADRSACPPRAHPSAAPRAPQTPAQTLRRPCLTLAASASTSPDAPIIFRLSRSHCTTAPPIKMLPSNAYSRRFCALAATVVISLCFDRANSVRCSRAGSIPSRTCSSPRPRPVQPPEQRRLLVARDAAIRCAAEAERRRHSATCRLHHFTSGSMLAEAPKSFSRSWSHSPFTTLRRASRRDVLGRRVLWVCQVPHQPEAIDGAKGKLAARPARRPRCRESIDLGRREVWIDPTWPVFEEMVSAAPLSSKTLHRGAVCAAAISCGCIALLRAPTQSARDGDCVGARNGQGHTSRDCVAGPAHSSSV